MPILRRTDIKHIRKEGIFPVSDQGSSAMNVLSPAASGADVCPCKCADLGIAVACRDLKR